MREEEEDRRRTKEFICFFFQAEDGIRDLVRSRGLGDVYKRQFDILSTFFTSPFITIVIIDMTDIRLNINSANLILILSLIHI
ncbi:hypothetical protein CDFC105_103909 [Clostridioides difficile]|nr:hypothetical protein CDFC105_103909 [Clostridioides difficile]